jgi:hypothetical protein
MARKRRNRSPLPALLLLGLAAVGGWAAWRHGPALLATWRGDDAPVAAAGTTAFDVCARASTADVARAVGAATAEARYVGAGADVPAAGSCTWDWSGGSIVASWFTPASLARGKVAESGHAYFASVATGLEYAFKEPPAPIAGLGDEAAAAGFGGGPEPAQLVVRRGDEVLTLVVRGADRAQAERVARLLVR